MKVAISRFRQAARFLRANGKPVTIPNIARAIGIPDAVVCSYCKGVAGLGEELGIVKTTGPKVRDYLEAAELLRAKGIVITTCRLMVMTCAKRTTVNMWMRRNSDIVNFDIVSLPRLRHMHMVRRMEWLRRLHPNRTVTLAKFARLIGRERGHIYRQLKKYPELRMQLGLSRD